MIHKNLFLLEYMVKNRIERDTERLDAIKNIGGLLSKASISLEDFEETELDYLLKKLVKTKEKPLSNSELELIGEIFSFNK